jgi:hypothetical protein
LITGFLLLFMGLARVSELASVVTETGRAEASRSGWYEARRPLQALVVGLMGAAWFLTCAVAIWRVPERRRRYLPTAITVFTLICFAGIRAVSLHHLDQLLYNRPWHGIRLASILELTGVALAVGTVATALSLGPRRDGDDGVVREAEEDQRLGDASAQRT